MTSGDRGAGESSGRIVGDTYKACGEKLGR